MFLTAALPQTTVLAADAPVGLVVNDRPFSCCGQPLVVTEATDLGCGSTRIALGCCTTFGVVEFRAEGVLTITRQDEVG